MLRSKLAALAAVAVGVVGLAAPAAEAAVVDKACPSGTTAHDYRALDGTNRAKTCFKAAGDWFYWKDINTDSIGSYAFAYFYIPGVTPQKYLRSYNYSGTANDTWWDADPTNIDEGRSLSIYACSEDVSSGVDYGCGSGTAVAAGDR